MPPKVSICLPNLNTRPYLPERFETIFNQTFQDWELIVCDNYSEDGAWEFMQEQARRDPRVRISQAPREGLYANWNNCIRQATGEYVYIATSDDTMLPDCLEKLVAALEAHPEISLAHCGAVFIDAKSAVIPGEWERWPCVRYFGEMINVPHIRPAGHDTILAFNFCTPYYSITQVLIRRHLFETAGLFESRWGSYGDLEWQMRATQLTPTIHVPENLATWRIHPKQATQMDRLYAARKDGWFLQMAEGVIEFSRRHQTPVTAGLPGRLRRFFLLEHMYEAWKNLPARADKARFFFRCLRTDPVGAGWFAWDYMRVKLGVPRPPQPEADVRRELAALGIAGPTVVPAREARPVS